MAFNFFKSYYGNLYKDAYKEANNAYQQILKVNNDLNESKLTYVNAPTFKSITKQALDFYQKASINKDTYESSQLKYGIDSLVSNTLNVPVSEVAKNRNIYWKNLFGTEDEKTIFEAIGDSYRSYYVMQDIANLNNKLYNSTDQIEIESLEEQISDLEDEYADNAKVVMKKSDYFDIIEALANGNTSLYLAQPEAILGAPVIFCDLATVPVIGDFSYSQFNYDLDATYESDKNIKTGVTSFVLTAYLDHKILMKSAFRLAKVTP